MRVVELWRYPVKSLQGERLTHAPAGPAGIDGDRHWAIRDEATGFTLTARREPALLFASAQCTPGGVAIRLPDGSLVAGDGDLSRWLGHPVRLVEASPDDRGIYETPTWVEDEQARPWETWEGPSGSYHDSGRTQVSLVSQATLGDWDRRRFRPNVVLDGSGEDGMVGQTVRVGGAELAVVKRIDRCVMTTRPQPDGLGRDLEVLRRVIRERAGCLAIGAIVRAPGDMQIGDRLEPV